MDKEPESKYIPLKPYKGYPITKNISYDWDWTQNDFVKTVYYSVTDPEDGEDYEEDLWTLKAAKEYIDKLIRNKNKD